MTTTAILFDHIEGKVYSQDTPPQEREQRQAEFIEAQRQQRVTGSSLLTS